MKDGSLYDNVDYNTVIKYFDAMACFRRNNTDITFGANAFYSLNGVAAVAGIYIKKLIEFMFMNEFWCIAVMLDSDDAFGSKLKEFFFCYV